MDIDIDMQTTFNPSDVFSVVGASRIDKGKLKKHPCGVYFQSMPIDPITKLAAIPYKDAESYGFTKIDFLHLSILDYFNSKDEIRTLLKVDPNWGLLNRAEVIQKLFQLHNNIDLVRLVKPRSIMALADCVALIRPGKLHLLDTYIKSPTSTRPMLYRKVDGEYSYKKGHAVSYAMVIVLQMHLIQSNIM